MYFKRSLLAASLLTIYNPLYANSDTEVTELDTIVVIGQKISRTAEETKESVAVVTQEDIEDYQLQELGDVYAQAANIVDLGNGQLFAIRGVSQDPESTGGGSGELASIYIDGVAYTGFAARLLSKQTWDVEQVEILRGPQSTNVGRNALIGAVVVNSKRPELGYYDAALRVGSGNNGTKNTEAMVNVPLGEIAAFRLTGQIAGTDGYIKNAEWGTDDYDNRETQNVRAQLLIDPEEDWSLNILAQYAKSDRGQSMYYISPENGYPEDSLTSYDDTPSYEDYDGFTASVNFKYQITSNLEFNSITAYLNADYERGSDGDRLPNQTGNNVYREGNDSNWSQELRFNYQDNKLKGTFGGFYTKVDQDVTSESIQTYNVHEQISNLLPPGFEIYEPTILALYPENVQLVNDGPTEQTVENIAAFTEWDYQVANKWVVSAGVRYDYEELTLYSTSYTTQIVDDFTFPDPSATGPLAPIVTGVNDELNKYLVDDTIPERSTSYHALLPQLGLTYLLNNASSISAFYKQGYRSGGVELATDGVLYEYDPEYLHNFELAYRGSWLDGDLTTSANTYYGSWKDQQVNICPDGNTLFCYTENAGESEIYGLELTSHYRINQGLSVFGSFGWAKTQFIDYDNGSDDYSGNQFAYSPEFTGALGGRYFFTNSLFATLQANYVDEMFMDQANNPEFMSDARTIFDLTTRYQGENFVVDGYIKNLTDEFYLSGKWDTSFGQGNLVRAGAPREFGINVTVYM